MMRLSAVAERFGVALHGVDATFVGVSTDSRSVAVGDLFVALVGDNFDGHQFLSTARQRGAVGALVTRRVEADIAQIVVGDSTISYGLLAQFWRSRFTLPVVALTGSNGKTTVKEMLRSILTLHLGAGEALLATEGNLNNHIGVPQMLLKLRPQHRLAVFEMGMNHLGEIDYLSRLVVPDVALLAMAGSAHLGELGSLAAIAQAKGEIFAGLRPDGIACINADDRFADYWRGLNHDRRVVMFGSDASCEVRGEARTEGLTLTIGADRAAVALTVPGLHNQRNALAAAAAVHALGVPLSTIAAGLANFQGIDGRLRRYDGVNGCRVIDDSYNANPDSMRAAIAVLAALPGKRLLVLGDMAELGADAAQLHAQIGDEARASGIDALYGFGALAQDYVHAFGDGARHYGSLDALLAELLPRLDGDSTVLVKGSRSARMERVVEKVATHYLKGDH